MTRPTTLPPTLTKTIDAQPNFSYSGRQRLKASFTAWANRSGPITQGPSHFATRDILPIVEGDPRRPIADSIDALQTAVVALEGAHRERGDGLDSSQLLHQLNRALVTYAWHP